jgi:hypothetical protein
MAQGYAFGRPAPLPSTADLIIGELTDGPVEAMDQRMTEKTPEALAPEAEDRPRFTGGYTTADLTGELGDLAESTEDDGSAVLPFPVQRTGTVAEDLIEASTGEFDLPEDPED